MKILIIKTSAIGDIIHAFSALSFIKAHIPNSTVHWLVEKPFSSLLDAHPQIDKVYCIDSKRWKNNFFSKETLQEIKELKSSVQKTEYDFIFDLQGNVKSALCLSIFRSKKKVGFAFKSVPEWPNCFFTNKRYNPPLGKNIREDYLFLIQKALNLPLRPFSLIPIELKISSEEKNHIKFLIEKGQDSQTKICVALGSNWKNKKLPVSTLTSYLKKHPRLKNAFYFLIYGNEKEKIEAQTFAKSFEGKNLIVERLSLPALQNFIADLDLIISMDSMPLHLAETTSTASLSFFGPSLAKKYCPTGEQHQTIQGKCPYGRTFAKRCSILRICKTGACIKDLKEKDIEDHVTLNVN
ncbi:hypothetical protein AB751O23_AH_00070 [Chlamydiales bacterium SCGC AB-751-O23]|jgi:heptosyltransferase I|nr:hypothetical protein AB751O23_AH_00070 [Chlamydiales bacterium SCGC AB-751-O23]